MVLTGRTREIAVSEEARIDPRVLRTRQLLQQAFNELMTEKTFHHITVQDITERASLNRATFYAHFEDKYALLNYSLRESLEALLKNRLPERAALTFENLKILTLIIFEFLGQSLGRCIPSTRIDEQMLIAAQVQQHLNDIIQQWLTCSQQKAGETLKLSNDVAPIISWLIFGAAMEWARRGRKESPECRVDETLAFLAPSLKPFLTVDETADQRY